MSEKKYDYGWKHEIGFEHPNFHKEQYKDHAYSPLKNYPMRRKCSTCGDQPTCERIETFNNDGCRFHTGCQVAKRGKAVVIAPHKINVDVKYLTRVRYTGISRVEI